MVKLIAFQGEPGAFSRAATHALFPDDEPVPCTTFEDTIAAVQSGKLQLVLPQWKPVGAFGEHLYAIRPYSPVVPRAVQAFIGYWRTALEDGFPIQSRP